MPAHNVTSLRRREVPLPESELNPSSRQPSCDMLVQGEKKNVYSQTAGTFAALHHHLIEEEETEFV
jgi:hypothetical protein